MTGPILSTYRLQLTPDFGFAAATALVPYLARLGISHVYCSPYLQAAKGSCHGYDVVDPSRVNEELGGEVARTAFVAELKAYGLGQILDIVPNHMAITADNPWWWDVLENGAASRFANFFDVEWDPAEQRLRNVVMLPVLAELSGHAIEQGKIQLTRHDGHFQIRYGELHLPAAPRSLDQLLLKAALRCHSEELGFLAESFGALPLATSTDQGSVYRRHRNKEVLRRLVERLLDRDPVVQAAVDQEVDAVNSDPKELAKLLDRQNYRLAHWRASGRDLGYRRFFDVTSLIGLRIEDEDVFALSNERLFAWLRANELDGVRIDHPDGLRDPKRYLERLRQAAPDAWLVVEKILGRGEELPVDWPVDGTTGYEFLNLLGGLFIDGDATAAFDELLGVVAGPVDRQMLIRNKKHQVLRDLLGSDLVRLTAVLVDACEGHSAYRDLTRHELQSALVEYIVNLRVYRTYVRPEEGADAIRPEDRQEIELAIAASRLNRADLEAHVFDALADILLLRFVSPGATEFAQRLQQFTGSAMAKGLEDTAFYAYPRFIGANEVGGEPLAPRLGTELKAFHQAAQAAQQNRPRAMLSSSTHDTKRSEDVRARLAVLSEMPSQWAAAVSSLRQLAAGHRTATGPDGAMELFYLQTLVGAWPISVERAQAYMIKACREAKNQTSWLLVDEGYETAIKAYVEATLSDQTFVAALSQVVARLTGPGRINSLSQTLVKYTYPGVPDLYQGCELWDLSLVDPDNRRAVDYRSRQSLLADLEGMPLKEIDQAADTGLPKLHVIWRALQLRQQRPDLFDEAASYEEVPVQGTHLEHVVSFTRGRGALTVAQRFSTKRPDGWGQTKLLVPPGRWRDVFSGLVFPGGWTRLADLLEQFPVALLVAEATRP